MKRWLSGLLAALTLFSLAACGGGADPAELPETNRSEDTLIDLPVAEDPEDPEETAPEEPAPEAPGEAAPEEPAQGDPEEAAPEEPPSDAAQPSLLPEDGAYTTKEDVALYIHTYGRLPDNFITKKEAQNLGWPGGDLEPYAPGMCIGGSRFGNYEGLLPEADGRTYTECDIDTLGAKSRGGEADRFLQRRPDLLHRGPLRVLRAAVRRRGRWLRSRWTGWSSSQSRRSTISSPGRWTCRSGMAGTWTPCLTA